VQQRMRTQLNYRAYRFDYLKNYFDTEIEEFQSDLQQSDKREDKQLLENWVNLD